MDVLVDLFNDLALDAALTSLVESLSTQMAALLPIGIGLMGIYAAPRIIKRVIHTFL
ncbi:MAG: hypothetical protein LBR98_10315 [Syntrophomonadaceae bacterium]|jgi:hypothetical protein|nr:hypothetical protein [Syntrophomonadaceae bacterium]